MVRRIHVNLYLRHERLLILCKLYAWQQRAVIRSTSFVIWVLCLCNLSQPRSGIPVLLLELKPYLLQASHQSAQCRLALCWISAGLTPTRCVRPVSLSHVSAAVSCSPMPPCESTWVEAHCSTRYRPEPKKPNQLWSRPAAPGSKWGLIPKKPEKDTEECLAHSTPFTQGLDWEELSFTQSFTPPTLCEYIHVGLWCVRAYVHVCKFCMHAYRGYTK